MISSSPKSYVSPKRTTFTLTFPACLSTLFFSIFWPSVFFKSYLKFSQFLFLAFVSHRRRHKYLMMCFEIASARFWRWRMRCLNTRYLFPFRARLFRIRRNYIRVQGQLTLILFVSIKIGVLYYMMDMLTWTRSEMETNPWGLLEASVMFL